MIFSLLDSHTFPRCSNRYCGWNKGLLIIGHIPWSTDAADNDTYHVPGIYVHYFTSSNIHLKKPWAGICSRLQKWPNEWEVKVSSNSKYELPSKKKLSLNHCRILPLTSPVFVAYPIFQWFGRFLYLFSIWSFPNILLPFLQISCTVYL